MNIEDAFAIARQKGFIKSSSEERFSVENLTSSQKVQLNRRGNEFFNNREYDKAQQLYLLTGYSDGLSRMGDYYMIQKDFVQALEMYHKAKMINKSQPLLEKLAMVMKNMIKEGE